MLKMNANLLLVHNMDPRKRLIIMINRFMATEEILNLRVVAAFGVCNLINLRAQISRRFRCLFFFDSILLFWPRFFVMRNKKGCEIKFKKKLV